MVFRQPIPFEAGESQKPNRDCDGGRAEKRHSANDLLIRTSFLISLIL